MDWATVKMCQKTVLSICSKVREQQTGLRVPAASHRFAPVREALGIQIYNITSYRRKVLFRGRRRVAVIGDQPFSAKWSRSGRALRTLLTQAVSQLSTMCFLRKAPNAKWIFLSPP